MLYVGIIVPTWHYFADPFKLQPLNELYFATVLEHYMDTKDVDVSVIDLRQIRLSESESTEKNFIPYIPQKDVFFYWIAKTADYIEILSIVKQIRKSFPKSVHIAGGTHVDNFPLECSQHFNAIVLGPGEESFIKIINDFMDENLQEQYIDDWKLVQYDNYPFPLRHYLPKESVVNTVLFEKYGGVPGTSAMFSRGCNFKCAYCVYNVPHFIQRRSPESVENEIEYLKNEYGVKGVNLRDEICIPLSKKIAIPFLEAIGRCNVIWRGQTKIGADRDVIKIARQTGCVELALGVESVVQKTLDIIDKRQTVEDAKDFINYCKSLGIKIKMCLIFGLPGEPQDIANVTRSFIDNVQPDFVNVSGFSPVPGSKIYENYQQYGIKYIDKDWSKHAHLVFRFSDEERFGLPFEYEEKGTWGNNFTRAEIINNIKELQHYVRDKGMTY